MHLPATPNATAVGAGTLDPVVRLVLSTVARVALAGVWLVSGSLKALDPEQTYLAVHAYDLLPGGQIGRAHV